MAEQWEYTTTSSTYDLNDLGKQGWEVAGTTLSSGSNRAEPVIILKRRKEIEKTRDSYGRDGR